MADNTNTKIFIGAAVCVVLQLFVGPIISISTIVPNFMLAFTIVCIVARPDKDMTLFAFINGLVYDLLCSGPVGAMSFILVIFAFIIRKALNKFDNINLGISLVTIFVSILLIELFYGIFQVALLVDISIMDMLAYKILPCTIYDVILSFVMFAIMIRLIAPPITTNPFDQNHSRW